MVIGKSINIKNQIHNTLHTDDTLLSPDTKSKVDISMEGVQLVDSLVN